ncbi:MAG: hypothetical protein ACLU38_11890 [Dysosmobacter sp.]
MYRIQTMNKISPVGLNRFPSELYEVGDAVQDPQGILVRSAKLLDLEFNPSLLAIARAGVGVNNIPLDRCRGGYRCFAPRRQRQRREGTGDLRHADGLPGHSRCHPLGPGTGGLRGGCLHRGGKGQVCLHRPGAL